MREYNKNISFVKKETFVNWMLLYNAFMNYKVLYLILKCLAVVKLKFGIIALKYGIM